MPDFREQLSDLLRGRVCVVGMGNLEYGDDGTGVRLAETLGKSGNRRASSCDFAVIVAGVSPERYVADLDAAAFDTVLFVDAVECGCTPGSVVLLDSTGMGSRFPQVSTHKLSLGLLAQLVEKNGRTKVWLLGVQPASLARGRGLSPTVALTVERLASLLAGQAEAAVV